MMYMDGGIEMDSVFGDGSGRDSGKGIMGMLMGDGIAAGKKGGGGKEEGSLLGNIGLGNLFGRD